MQLSEASAFTEEAGRELCEAYGSAAGVALLPEILVILGPILIKVVTDLLASCTKPPTPAALKAQAQNPGWLVDVMLTRQTRKAARRAPPELEFNVDAAKAAILKVWVGADEPKLRKALAVAKMVG